MDLQKHDERIYELRAELSKVAESADVSKNRLSKIEQEFSELRARVWKIAGFVAILAGGGTAAVSKLMQFLV